MTRVTKIFFTLCCVLCFTIAGYVTDPAYAVMKLQLAHEQPEIHPYHVGATEFAKLLKEYSKGEMEVTIFPNGTMGKASALAESCSMGTMDFAAVFSIILEAYSPKFGVLTMPYCFSNWDHADKVLDGPIGDELRASVESKGIKVLAFWRNGLAEIHSRMPIRTPADIKGKKLRIQEGPSYAALSKAFGAVTTPMSFGEVYSALQLGTVDAQTQTINNVYTSKMFEVGKYFTKINMNFNTQPFIMSMQLWKSLTPEQQDIVTRAARDATKAERAYHVKDTQTSYDGFVKGGGEVIELSEEELQQWRDVCKPVYEDPQFAGVMEIFNRIQKQK
ncbi:MAG: TRAP transporter substrate-binding protein [Synergistaceae bacterium]|nr:TRAP transporter substrate-binding protein [Synergistaceae bacterium]